MISGNVETSQTGAELASDAAPRAPRAARARGKGPERPRPDESAGTVSARVAKHSSASVEHFTPPHIVSMARRLMGSIDLDPASCAVANQIVGATEWYDAEEDGLTAKAGTGGCS